MLDLSPANLADRRNDLRGDQIGPAYLVPRYVPHDPDKQGISSIELGRRLGVSQPTAWKIKHKLKQVMMERDATKKLTGRIEIDDAYLGGERCGSERGRGRRRRRPSSPRWRRPRMASRSA